MDEYLSRIGLKIEIVSGGARGADKLGEKYAREKNYPIKSFPAEWQKYGKSAGPIRNAKMVDYANVCVAFWDRESKGTHDMIMRSYDKKLNVLIPAWFN